MNENLLRRLLKPAGDHHLLSPDAIDAVVARLNATPARRDSVRTLAKSTSRADRVRALAYVMIEAIATVTALADDVVARLAKSLEVLSQEPRSELLEHLAELVAALLATWPDVPGELFARLEAALAAPDAPLPTTHEGSTGAPASPPPASGGPLNSGPDNEEDTMAFELEIDVRGLPPALQSKDAQKAYIDGVTKHLKTATGGMDPLPEAVAYAVGKLLRTGQFVASASFYSFVKTTWDQLTTEYRARAAMVSGMTVVQRIVKLLAGSSNGVNIPAKKWTVQQLAFIFDQTLETLPTIAPDDSGFTTRVDRAYLDYASGDVGYDGFQLPELDATSDGDLLPQNMMAAGRLYGALEFERLRLLSAVDRVAELWRAGVVPIGNDSGGQLLNEYFWSREDRLTEAARGMIFGRLFGISGTETSKDSQPNKGFETLLRRFLTNVAQLRRLQEQQAVISNPGESRTLASENVRKTGRELATNLSLYGWGSAYFDATRIDAHIAMAYKIAADAQIQKAFAATTPWQVVERVSQQEFGVTPNIVKHHTMGQAGRRIIEILAQNPNALTSRAGEFHELLGEPLWNELSRLALAWLSVNGVTSEQLVSYSAPVDGIASPSIPTMPGAQAASPNINRLRDMVSSGQMPSLDQLQRMFN